MSARLLQLCGVLLAVLAGDAPAHAEPAPPLPPALAAAVDELKRDTDLPILLPSRLPIRREIFASGEGKPGGYRLRLESDPDCDGANACFLALLSAERGKAPTLRKRLLLAGGTEARFLSVSCGGSCAPAQIEWVTKGVLYTIQINLAEADAKNAERIFKTLAEDAIAAGPR